MQKFYRVTCTATKVEDGTTDGTIPGSPSKPSGGQPMQMMQNVTKGVQNNFSGATFNKPLNFNN